MAKEQGWQKNVGNMSPKELQRRGSFRTSHFFRQGEDLSVCGKERREFGKMAKSGGIFSCIHCHEAMGAFILPRSWFNKEARA